MRCHAERVPGIVALALLLGGGAMAAREQSAPAVADQPAPPGAEKAAPVEKSATTEKTLPGDEARAAIDALLGAQSEAWSRGDIEAFCSVYAEDALFLSPSGVTRGRQAVLDRYRQRYPGKEDMGTLTLEVLEFRPAPGGGAAPSPGKSASHPGRPAPPAVGAASVAARWTLAYPDRPGFSGTTLIVLHRRGGGWVIVQDASM